MVYIVLHPGHELGKRQCRARAEYLFIPCRSVHVASEAPEARGFRIHKGYVSDDGCPIGEVTGMGNTVRVISVRRTPQSENFYNLATVVRSPFGSCYVRGSLSRLGCVMTRPRRRVITSVACERCARQRRGCTDTKPCDPCVAAGVECIERIRQSDCIQCKADGKQCTIARPCRNCIHLGVPCLVESDIVGPDGDEVLVEAQGNRDDGFDDFLAPDDVWPGSAPTSANDNIESEPVVGDDSTITIGRCSLGDNDHCPEDIGFGFVPPADPLLLHDIMQPPLPPIEFPGTPDDINGLLASAHPRSFADIDFCNGFLNNEWG